MKLHFLFILCLWLPLISKSTELINSEDPKKWLDSLSQEEQRVAIALYQAKLNEVANKILENTKDAKDRLRSAKILFCGYLLTSELTTKDKEQRMSALLVSDALGDIIAGKGTTESRRLQLETALLSNKKIMESISDSSRALFQIKYASKSEEVNKKLVTGAIRCAFDEYDEKSNQEHKDTCTPKGVDVCKLAKKIASDTAQHLPIRLNNQLSLQTVFAIGNNFIMTAMFGYDKNYLEQTLIKSNISASEVMSSMKKSTKIGICQAKTATRSFIDLGGAIHYVYKFNDGDEYAKIQITTCE